MPYLSTSAVVIHYEEALYQVYAPLPLNQIESRPWLAFVVMWFETDPQNTLPLWWICVSRSLFNNNFVTSASLVEVCAVLSAILVR